MRLAALRPEQFKAQAARRESTLRAGSSLRVAVGQKHPTDYFASIYCRRRDKPETLVTSGQAAAVQKVGRVTEPTHRGTTLRSFASSQFWASSALKMTLTQPAEKLSLAACHIWPHMTAQFRQISRNYRTLLLHSASDYFNAFAS